MQGELKFCFAFQSRKQFFLLWGGLIVYFTVGLAFLGGCYAVENDWHVSQYLGPCKVAIWAWQ